MFFAEEITVNNRSWKLSPIDKMYFLRFEFIDRNQVE
jgi:hypothetical protein